MQQAVLARQQLDEGAEALDGDYGAGVLLANLRDFDNLLDAGLGQLAAGVFGCDIDCAVLGDLDGGAGLFLQAADYLAAAADDLADLIHRDLYRDDARRVLAQLGAGGVDGLNHLVKDESPSLFGLLQRLSQDVYGQALGLVVHLQGSDAALGAADLEVHVAEEVLDALDVGKHGHAVALFYQPHRDARDRTGNRHAGVHQGQGRAAGRSHRRRAVGLGHLGYDADGVREIQLYRQYRQQGALG